MEQDPNTKEWAFEHLENTGVLLTWAGPEEEELEPKFPNWILSTKRHCHIKNFCTNLLGEKNKLF